MPAYSATSTQRLSTCHQDLQTLFGVVITERDCSILCGSRPEADQEVAFKAGASKLRWPNSNHNVDGKKRKTSWAVDVAPYPIDWKDASRFDHFAGLVLGIASQLFAQGKMKHRVRWGGDWDKDGLTRDESFIDRPHFELVGVADGE